MVTDIALLHQILQIERPWQIQEYRLDMHMHTLDVWIGYVDGVLRPPASLSKATWRHIRIGTTHIQIHLEAPAGMNSPAVAWVGDAGLPFTRQLAQQVFTYFNEGVKLPAVCTLLGLPLAEVWRYRYALDNGKTGVQARQSSQAAQAVQSVVQAAANAVAEQDSANGVSQSDVPDVADPVWLALIEGRHRIDIRTFSLKLLLTRMRAQLMLISDDQVRLLKLRDLHRYFLKNERVLAYELSQMKVVS